MKYLKSISAKAIICYLLLSSVGCKGSMDRRIVRDREGNYYQLNGNTVEVTTYFLIPVDTIDIKPFSD